MLSPTKDRADKRLDRLENQPKSAAAGAVQFDWPLANQAESLLRERITAFLKRNSFASRLAEDMREETGTDFFEWLDHLVLSPADEEPLRRAGFAPEPHAETPNGETIYAHPRATLPCVLLRQGREDSPSVVSLRPESIADFVARHHLSGKIEGEPFSRYRRVTVAEEGGVRLEAVERHAYRGFVPAALKSGELKAIIQARELWQTRRRLCASDAEGFSVARRILVQVMDLVGRDLACQFFFETERE